MDHLDYKKKFKYELISNWRFFIWRYVKKENCVIWIWFSNQVLSVSKMKKLTLVCRLLFYVCVCGVIINFVNLFRQMPVNTRRQTAGLSPLIKFSK